MKSQCRITYEEIISVENLLAAWREFVVGKAAKRDVAEFGLRLADSIVQLHADLANGTYVHGGYQAFNISDPKPRRIHKASVRDRVVHHAIHRQLYPFFDKTFIADSFSCRRGKGVHKALSRFQAFALKASRNHTRTVWVLKCDVKKFFATIDHAVLLRILAGYIPDRRIVWLLHGVIESFAAGSPGKGLPLGSLTSQLFSNLYMNEFDQFVKHRLRAQYYIRYSDDFVLLSDDRRQLLRCVPEVGRFLARRLHLSLHPNKLFIKTLASGVDFLGWVHFPHHRVLRAATRRRVLKRIRKHPTNETLQSYLGLLAHGNTFKLRQALLNAYGLWKNRDQKALS